MLKIIKNIKYSSLIILIIFLFNNFAYANRDITNIQFKPSVYAGKEGKSYETVKVDSGEPVIGKKSYKFVALPFDCGKDRDGSYTDCGNSYSSTGKGGDRVRSELSGYKSRFGAGEVWLSFSLFLPNNYKTISPTVTSFYQVYSGSGNGPNLKIQDTWGTLFYYRFNNYKTISKHTLIDVEDMKGKWTDFIINAKFTTNKKKGFIKIWVNENLKVDIKEDQTAAGSTGKGHYIKAGLYQTGITRYLKVIGEDPNWQKGQDPGKFPTQIVYMDNIFKVRSKEKLDARSEKLNKN